MYWSENKIFDLRKIVLICLDNFNSYRESSKEGTCKKGTDSKEVVPSNIFCSRYFALNVIARFAQLM